MESIYFENPITIETLPAGTKVYRYSKIGNSDPKEFYFLDPLTLPGEVGKASIYKNPNIWRLEVYELNAPVEVLKTTTNLGGSPGATQIWSRKIQNSSTLQTNTTN